MFNVHADHQRKTVFRLAIGLAGAALLLAVAHAQVIPASLSVNESAPPVPGIVTAPVESNPPALAAIAATVVATAPADEQDDREVLIIQALDQPTDLKVDDAPIQQAIGDLAQNTGIPIRLASGTLSLLPYGSKTTLSATIQNRPLRESLTALLRPLGLEFQPTRDHVLIQPTAPLRRIAHRATWEELALLEKLASQPWSNELLGTLELQFQDASATDADVSRETLGRLAASVGAGSAAEVLEQACHQYGWTWYPNGQTIVILPRTRQVERQLEKRVSLRYGQMSLLDTIQDLGQRAAVTMHFEPGVLASLPPQTAERFSLSMENGTIRQALEVIVGETGLNYFIESDGVRITSSAGLGAGATNGSSGQVEATAQATVAALRSNSIVGEITMPLPDGTSYSFFIRQLDLPPEIDQLREDKIQAVVNQVRKQLQAETRQD